MTEKGTLDERLAAAIEPHIRSGARAGDVLRGALRDGYAVVRAELLREFASAGASAAGAEPRPAHTLRTLPAFGGDVVLATEVRGADLRGSPLLAVRTVAGHRGDLWCTPANLWPRNDGTLAEGIWPGDDRITAWIPARVVRDDEHGPRVALERILALPGRDDLSCIKKVQAIEFAARTAHAQFQAGDPA